ncbi:hypothetical protein [Pedobacter agri]|uniref:hypothetical protein n=1 Tax=Pedobacter agri TaxID=454586 RepID=UPI00292E976D|nr:hypothetical protein [Pedobacter agri]
MKYKFFILATLISFATYAQKKPAKKTRYLPPPPVRPIREADPESLVKNSFPETITFKWKIQPATLTTITPTDIFEKSYTFSSQGKNVRISTVYPKNGFEYKKPKDGEVELAQNLIIKYKDYKKVAIEGDNINIVSDDSNETIRLMLTKKGNQLINIKELSSNKVFTTTDRYEGEPTLMGF